MVRFTQTHSSSHMTRKTTRNKYTYCACFIYTYLQEVSVCFTTCSISKHLIFLKLRNNSLGEVIFSSSVQFLCAAVTFPDILPLTESNRTDGNEIEYGYPITCGDSRAVLLFKKFVCPGINVRCVKVSLVPILTVIFPSQDVVAPWFTCQDLSLTIVFFSFT